MQETKSNLGHPKCRDPASYQVQNADWVFLQQKRDPSSHASQHQCLSVIKVVKMEVSREARGPVSEM